MFKSKTHNPVLVTLSPELQEALTKLHDDLRVLEEFQAEIGDGLNKVLAGINGQVERVEEAAVTEVMLDEFKRSSAVLPPPPEGFLGEREGGETRVLEDDRIRETPFNRVPRSKQIAWLREVLANGEWIAPVTLAREYANDERHFRYLRSAITTRLREMHEEEIVERRTSSVRGSMFDYRLRPREEA